MSLINIAKIDFSPSEGGGGSTPTGKIVINENGTYDVTEKATAEVNVPVPILQSQWSGSVDEFGLKEIGWTEEDIDVLKSNICWHDWENDDYKVSEYDKSLVKKTSYSGDSNLRVLPKFDFSDITNMRSMFYRCSSLISIPVIDTSNVTDMYFMFSSCSSLTSIPQLDTQNVADMGSMFSSCSNLTTIPLLDTQNVTTMKGMFNNCSNLTTIPLLDTQNVTTMQSMFDGCSKLTSIPLLDTQNVTTMQSMFNGCSKLTSIPQLNTQNVTNMGSMFSVCNALTTVEGIDFSGHTQNVTKLFGSTSSRPKLTRFIVNGKINVSIMDNYSIGALTAIDYDSVKSILEAANRTDNTDAKTLAFNRTMQDPNGELTSLIASCTTKGWTINGLTLTA